MIELKSKSEIEKMRVSGHIVAEILQVLKKETRAGITTWELDSMASDMIHKKKVIPAFKGYRGFPGCLCVSINEEVVHGIPTKKRKINKGDLVSLDFGVIYEGYYGDAALSFVLADPVKPEIKKILQATEEALYKGIEQVKIGNHISDISHAVQSHVERNGFSVVRDFVGHGIGRNLHEDPQIPNYGRPGEGPLIEEGMVLAIEPMVNMGSEKVEILSDGWTVVTKDKSLSAHFEHTVAVINGRAEILTFIESSTKK